MQIVIGLLLTIVATTAGYRYGERYPLRLTRRMNMPGEYRGYTIVLVLLMLAMQFLRLQVGWFVLTPLPIVFGAMQLGSHRSVQPEPRAPVSS